MSILSQTRGKKTEWHHPGRTYSARRKIRTKRNIFGLWDTYTKKGKPFTTNSLTHKLAIQEHKRKLERIEFFKKLAKKKTRR